MQKKYLWCIFGLFEKGCYLTSKIYLETSNESSVNYILIQCFRFKNIILSNYLEMFKTTAYMVSAASQ